MEREVEEATTQLTKHCEQTIALVTAKAKNNQATWELLIAKHQADAKSAKEELEANRSQPGMDDTRIRILIDKHHRLRNHSTTQAKNGHPKMPSYTSYAPTLRTDGRRDEDFTRWMKPVSRPFVRT